MVQRIMRLTEKINNYYFSKGKIESDHNEEINKLGQLEDIEDELGIDLITLNKIKHKKECLIRGYNDKLWRYRIYKIDLINGITIGVYDGCKHTEEIKDYGKK